jgi:hypothetical protein
LENKINDLNGADFDYYRNQCSLLANGKLGNDLKIVEQLVVALTADNLISEKDEVNAANDIVRTTAEQKLFHEKTDKINIFCAKNDLDVSTIDGDIDTVLQIRKLKAVKLGGAGNAYRRRQRNKKIRNLTAKNLNCGEKLVYKDLCNKFNFLEIQTKKNANILRNFNSVQSEFVDLFRSTISLVEHLQLTTDSIKIRREVASDISSNKFSRSTDNSPNDIFAKVGKKVAAEKLLSQKRKLDKNENTDLKRKKINSQYSSIVRPTREEVFRRLDDFIDQRYAPICSLGITIKLNVFKNLFDLGSWNGKPAGIRYVELFDWQMDNAENLSKYVLFERFSGKYTLFSRKDCQYMHVLGQNKTKKEDEDEDEEQKANPKPKAKPKAKPKPKSKKVVKRKKSSVKKNSINKRKNDKKRKRKKSGNVNKSKKVKKKKKKVVETSDEEDLLVSSDSSSNNEGAEGEEDSSSSSD